MIKELPLILISLGLLLTACTQTKSALQSTTPTSTTAASPSPTALPPAPTNCYYQEVQCIKAPCNPILVCSSPEATPTTTPKATIKSIIKQGSSSTNVNVTTKSDVKSYSTSNSNTNINITSNDTKVKITNKNGKRYAEINGKEVELDANGCYDYDQNGTKIHACVNS